MENGKPSGKGILFYANGKVRYKGDFVDGNYTGQGTYYWEDGRKYEGGFLNNIIHGEGTFYNADGTVEDNGQFKETEFDGRGKGEIEKNNGESLEDDLTGDKPNVQEKEYYPDGKVKYIGEYRYGKYKGQGSEYYRFGGKEKYRGEYKDGKYNGQGTYYGEYNNKYYVGEFKDCKASHGKSYYASGKLRSLV